MDGAKCPTAMSSGRVFLRLELTRPIASERMLMRLTLILTVCYWIRDQPLFPLVRQHEPRQNPERRSRIPNRRDLSCAYPDPTIDDPRVPAGGFLRDGSPGRCGRLPRMITLPGGTENEADTKAPLPTYGNQWFITHLACQSSKHRHYASRSPASANKKNGQHVPRTWSKLPTGFAIAYHGSQNT